MSVKATVIFISIMWAIVICIVAISLIRADKRDHDEQDGSDIK